jgi:hypothetical protein
VRPQEAQEIKESQKGQQQGEGIAMRILRSSYVLIPLTLVFLALIASPALAAEAHPPIQHTGFETDTFSNPNGIAVEESTGDVYVADIATDTVSRFDADGNPIEFPALHSNTLTGSATPAHSFSFPDAYGTPAQVAVDNSTDPADPSRGDLYVMDAGHDVIDKFNSNGEYLYQITAPFESGVNLGEGAESGLKGLAIAGDGDLRVLIQGPSVYNKEVPVERVDQYDNAVDNDFINQIEQLEFTGDEYSKKPAEFSFSIGPTGADYVMYECGCVEKYGSGERELVTLGRVDNASGDVAMAVDPATGHLYIDKQSSVVEWDTGGMDGYAYAPEHQDEPLASAAFISEFGSLQLSGVAAQQGGIAVNGATGDIYVSNPANGKVYVYATAPPAVAAGSATNIAKTSVTLQGDVDPRDVPVSSCEFEYEKAPREAGSVEIYGTPVTAFLHSVPCQQTPAQVGSGASPVGVSADIDGLEPGTLYYFRLTAGNANGESASQGMFATADSGFGLKSFSVSFVNANGATDTQAGSHPYEMVTSFTFNTRAVRQIATEESPYRYKPVGSPKNIIFIPPPGLVGNPDATEAKCKLSELAESSVGSLVTGGCPPGSKVGVMRIQTDGYGEGGYWLWNMAPPRGLAAQFGTNILGFPNAFIDAALQTGGQYPVQTESLDIPAIESLYEIKVTLFGTVGGGGSPKPFLSLPTGCTGPLRSTISTDSYENPGHYVSESEVSRNTNGEPVVLSGCSNLAFPPAIAAAPDVSDASSSSGLTVGVHVPQKSIFNPDGLAESSLRDTTVALPAGVAINPAGADGLEACSEGLAGFRGFEEFNREAEPGVKWATFAPFEPGVTNVTPTPIASEALRPGVNVCPNGSKIATVKIKTPLLPNPLEGAVYLAAQNENPFGSLIAMYMLVEDPVSGSTVKLAGEVRLCQSAGEVVEGMSCQAPGQIVTTFENTPDLPFEELELHFFGGERAPLSTPSRCGTYTTKASFTPWDGNAPVTSESSFNIEHGPNGTPCPGASLPFDPSLTAGTASNQAGGFTPFTLTMSREDGQQTLRSVSLRMPPGLSGLLTGVELCPEAQADEGTCGPNSLIGETTVSVGVGDQPFTVKGGRVYLTGPYEGAPFGLSIVNPAKAGPYDLEKTPSRHPTCDCIVVRSKIEVNPTTAGLTVTSDNEPPYNIPTMIEGIPLEIQHVNVTITRPGFTFNPTDCSPLSIAGELHSTEGATDSLSVPFQATNCASLGFKPRFSASTSGKTSRANGASLHVKLTYPKAPFGSQANIAKVKVDLPKQLPSRLTTLQKACIAATFDANPASCPPASIVGRAKAITPLIPVPLEGPAYFVSHGGAKFPELIVVLEGYGVRIDLHGETFISKAGITSSTFATVPDQPVGSFELTLPEGKDSALAANGDLCKSKLAMPTAFVAQNGAEIHESTKIGVTGCPKSKKARKAAGKRRKRK